MSGVEKYCRRCKKFFPLEQDICLYCWGNLSSTCKFCGCEINTSDLNYCTCCGAELFKITHHATGQRGRHSNIKMSYSAMKREKEFKKWYVKLYPNGENTAKTYSSKLKNLVDKMPDALQRKLKSNLFEYDDAKEFENAIKKLFTSDVFLSFDNKNHSQASTAIRQYLSFLDENSDGINNNGINNNGKINFISHRNKDFVPPVVISDETVFINGNTYRLYRKEYETVQDFIRSTTERLLFTNSIPLSEIKRLLDKQYCKIIFDLQYAFLSLVCVENDGVKRYYKEKICGYYLCSQWQRQLSHSYDRKIATWLKKLSQQRNISSANHGDEHDTAFQQNKCREQTNITNNENDMIRAREEEYRKIFMSQKLQDQTQNDDATIKKEVTTKDVYNILKNVNWVSGVGYISCDEKRVSIKSGKETVMFPYEAILKAYKNKMWTQQPKGAFSKEKSALAKKVFDSI